MCAQRLSFLALPARTIPVLRVALPGHPDGFRTALQQSFESSLRSALLIIKLIVPLYILADILLYFDLLRHLTFLFAPITSFLDLPAEAAMAVAAGIFLNLYAAIAFAAPLGLTPSQWTILAVFLGVCHSLIVECAVMKRLGVSSIYSVFLRGTMAFVTVLPVMIMPASFFGSRVEQGTAVLKQYDSFSTMLTGSFLPRPINLPAYRH